MENIKILCEAPNELALRLCPERAESTLNIQKKFTDGFELLSKCHNLYNKKDIEDDEIKKLGKKNFFIPLLIQYNFRNFS